MIPTFSQWNEKSDLLTRLGLTINQTKILLALERIDAPATVQTIARYSGVTREKVYCVMPELEGRGFVERIIVSPIKYKAISFSSAVSILLRRLKEDSQEIRKIARTLQAQAVQRECVAQNSDEESIVQCKKDIGYKARVQALENTAKSLDVVMPGFRGETDWEPILRLYHKLSKRNASMRYVIQQPIESKALWQKLAALTKNPLFEIRTAQGVTTPMSLYIIDGKQVTIATSLERYPDNYSVVCTRNPIFVSLTLGYFETTWNRATPLNQ